MNDSLGPGRSWPIRWGTLPAVFLAAVGCSDGRQRPECHPVRGQVLRQNRPVAEAQIIFHPLGDAPRAFPKPIAVSDAQGRFALTTFAAEDGAPSGDYAITVELRAPQQRGEEVVRDGPNLLPPRYATPTSSPLRYTVVEGNNDVPPIAVASP